MKDLEIKAMEDIHKALESLTEVEARNRVLTWTLERYGIIKDLEKKLNERKDNKEF
jgi:hypothetical protein